MVAIRINPVCTCTTDNSYLMKHLLHPWPTSALISLFDVFTLLFFQGRKYKKTQRQISSGTPSNLSWILWVAIFLCDRKSSTAVIVPHQYQFLLVEIKLAFMACHSIVSFAFLIDLSATQPMLPIFLTFRCLSVGLLHIRP